MEIYGVFTTRIVFERPWDNQESEMIRIQYDRLDSQGQTIEWYDGRVALSIVDLNPELRTAYDVLVTHIDRPIKEILWNIDQQQENHDLPRRKRKQGMPQGIPLSLPKIDDIFIDLCELYWHPDAVILALTYKRLADQAAVFGYDGGIFIKVPHDISYVNFDSRKILGMPEGRRRQVYNIIKQYQVKADNLVEIWEQLG